MIRRMVTAALQQSCGGLHAYPRLHSPGLRTPRNLGSLHRGLNCYAPEGACIDAFPQSQRRPIRLNGYLFHIPPNRLRRGRG